MDCVEILRNLKQESLRKASEAVVAGESQQIILLGRRLEMIDKLTARAEDLQREVEKLVHVDEGVPLQIDSGTHSEGESGREGGERARISIVNVLSAAGIELQRIKGATYRLPNGSLIGIAYATERQPNRWFLGLTRGKFDHALLLCEETPEKVHALVLSQDFLAKHGKLSSSGDGIKFNVTRSGSSFHLNIPGKGAVPVPKLETAAPDLKNNLGIEA